MAFKILSFFCLMTIFTSCLGDHLPVVPAAYSVPYASSYSAHAINHAISVPVAAPLVAAHHVAAPLVAPHHVAAPLVAAPAAAAYPYHSHVHGFAAPFIAGK